MNDRPAYKMTRQELEDEVRLLRAALARVGGRITTSDILRDDRDKECRHEPSNLATRIRKRFADLHDENGREQTGQRANLRDLVPDRDTDRTNE